MSGNRRRYSGSVRLRLAAAVLALAAGAAAVVLATVLVRSALADGDPASDILLGANVFFPYTPSVSGPLQRALTAETSAARRAGYPIKVALIESRSDLGAVPSLFGRPQQYATFLDQEISLIGIAHPPLLVVMPDGFGVAGLPKASRAAVPTLGRPQAASQSDGLAEAALAAVPKLAAADGHPLPAAAVRSAGRGRGGATSGDGSALLIAAIAVAVAVLAAGAIGWRRRTFRLRRGLQG